MTRILRHSFNCSLILLGIVRAGYCEELSVDDEQKISVAAVIEIMRQNESKIQCISYEAEGHFVESFRWNGKIWEYVGHGDPGDKPRVIKNKCAITWNVIDGHYCAEINTQSQYMAKLPGGVRERLMYFDMTAGISNDGQSFRNMSSGRVTSTRPDWQGAELVLKNPMDYGLSGVVADCSTEGKYFSNNNDFLTEHAINSGLSWIPPNAWTSSNESPRKLSQLLMDKLHSKDLIAARMTQDRQVDILYSVIDPVHHYMLRIFYDPMLGRVNRYEVGGLTLKWVGEDYSGQPGPFFEDWMPTEIAQLTYEGTEVIPSEVQYVYCLPFFDGSEGTLRTGQRWLFLKRQINPPINSDSFAFQFPNGTVVRDDIRRTKYVVGRTLPDDQESIKEFLRDHELLKKDEVVASGNYKTWLAALTLVFALLVVVRWLRQKRRWSSKGTVPILIIAMFLLSSRACAQEERNCGQLAVLNCPWLRSDRA